MNINTDKSAIVHFRLKNQTQTNQNFYFKDKQIPMTNEYKYLGIIIDEYLTFQKAAEMRNDQATKALWSIQTKIQVLSGRVYKKLFESIVQPILDYGSIIWSHHTTQQIREKVQNRAYRCFLGVGSCHPLAALEGDMCWMPTKYRHKLQLILFWCRLLKLENKNISKLVYNNARKIEATKTIKCWIKEIKCILYKYELKQWWITEQYDGFSMKEIKKIITNIFFRDARDQWNKNVKEKPKLRTYILFKRLYEPEQYVIYVKCRAHRALLAQIRGGSASLEIELGRYRGLDVNKRICKLCSKDIEDEIHFCIKCTVLEEERERLFKYMEKIYPDFCQLNVEDQFIKVINDANFHPPISKHLYKMFMKRSKSLNI